MKHKEYVFEHKPEKAFLLDDVKKILMSGHVKKPCIKVLKVNVYDKKEV